MRFIPMSESELSFDLFYQPTPSTLDHYEVWLAEGMGANVRQNWCRAEIGWEKGIPGQCAVRLTRRISTEGIPTFGRGHLRLFMAIAQGVVLRVSLNGRRHELRGHGDPAYYDLPLPEERIRSLVLEYIPEQAGIGAATLIWMALLDAQREPERLAQHGHYDPSWEGFLVPAGQEPEPAVQMGLLFGPRDLDALRAKARSPLYRPWLEQLRRQAQAMLAVQPETLIGRFAAGPLHYTRPMERKGLNNFGPIHGLALAGLLDGDVALLRHAARWMLSVASCEYWYNDFGGELPGLWWHHRAFIEASFCFQLALGLDWAGSLLTQDGQELIRDAISRRGMPRIQHDYIDPHVEEIRHINQGIVFNSGRILGLLALAKAWPRAASRLAEAEADGLEMFNNTFTGDGGSVEGPSYWQYTLGAGLPGVLALARYRGCAVADLLPAKMRRAPGYPAILASTARPGQGLKIGDCHHPPVCPADLAAMLHVAFPGPESERLAAYALQHDQPADDLSLLLIYGPQEVAPVSRLVPEFGLLEHTGHALICREMPDVGPVRLQLVGGPVARLTVGGSHSHDDRGNILLEAGGEEILVDRGIGSYSGALGNLAKRPDAHNLLVPDSPDGAPTRQNLAHTVDVCPQATYREGLFRTTIHITPAWPAFVRHAQRTVVSAAPGVFEITDDLELDRPLGATFHLHTPCQARQEGQAWVLQGQNVQVRVEPQWTVQEARFAEEDFGIQREDARYGHLQLRAAPAMLHQLVTRLTVEKR